MIDVNEKLDKVELICLYWERGKELYNTFIKTLKSLPSTEIIVSSANLGDTVFIATLAKAYKEQHHVKNLLICAKKRQAEAVEWFEGVDGTIPLDDTEMVCLRYYFTISRKFYENGIRYGHIPCDIEWLYPGSFFHIAPRFKGAPLITIWEERILDLKKNSPTGEIVVSDTFIPYENEEKYKNAVLIAPAAFTNKGIPESFWEKLTTSLKEKGLEVYCNSGGLPYDQIINGSQELVLGTKELIVNAGFFKHIIAVRSGFTDLVSKTDAKMSVLHLGGTVDGPLRVEYGTRNDDVRDLGRMEGIFPIQYCAEREDEIIQLLLEDVENTGESK